MSRVKLLVFGWIGWMLIGSACHFSGNKKMEEDRFKARVHAPEFPTYAAWLNTDTAYTLNDFKGRFVLLDFWTYCCINCMHVLPDLQRLEDDFPNLIVVGVHSAKFTGEQSDQNIESAILRYNIHHPVINDYQFDLWKQYGIRAWPTMALIDPEGYLVGTRAGENIYPWAKSLIDSLTPVYAQRGSISGTRPAFALLHKSRPKTVVSFPSAIEADTIHSRLFVSDAGNSRILVLKPDGTILQTIGQGMAGKQDGPFNSAMFNHPQGLAYNADQDVLYVADTENHTIRKADLKTGQVSTVLGSGKKATTNLPDELIGLGNDLNSPWDVAWFNKQLIIAMAGSHQLYAYVPGTNTAKRFAGTGREALMDGSALQAALAQPSRLLPVGGRLYFIDSESSSLRYVQGNQVHTLIGKGLFDFGDVIGTFNQSRFQHPLGVCVGEAPGELVVVDTYNNRLKKINVNTGTSSNWLGSGISGAVDGSVDSARFSEPNQAAWLLGKCYITDTNNGMIRVFDPKTGRVNSLPLKGMENLKPVSLPGMPINSKKGKSLKLNTATKTIRFTVNPPVGMHLNQEAPNFIEITSDNPSVASIRKFTFKDGVFSYKIPVELHPGKTKWTFHLEIYYCDNGQAGRCYTDQTDWIVDLDVVEEGGEDPVITFTPN